MAKLTKGSVEALQPADKDYIVFDDALHGFGVRVLPSGRKTFLAQYRAQGRTRRVKLGVFGTVTADAARRDARRVLGDVAGGANPAEQISFERKAPTVAGVCERFLKEHVAQHCKASTQREYRRSVDLFIKPAFGPRKVGEITRADVAQLHHDMRDMPYQANRTLGVLSKLFNLAEVWGLRPDGSNPCRHVQKYKEAKRERFLSPDELARLGQVLDAVAREEPDSAPAVNAIRLLILTGCRLKEIQTLKWEHVDPPYLRLPDSKTGARKVPINDAVQQVLATIERQPDNPYVIAGRVPGQHLTDLQRPWRRIRARAGLDDVRIHDLRHTYASNALASGLPIEMVGKLLGHTQIQTTMRYAHLADDPIREAASRVANGLGQAINGHGTAGNVRNETNANTT